MRDNMTDDYDDRKFDDAMITQMKTQLGDSICTVKFTKENGDEREMKCTTNLRYIPKRRCLKVMKETMIESCLLFSILILMNGDLLDMKEFYLFIIQAMLLLTIHQQLECSHDFN